MGSSSGGKKKYLSFRNKQRANMSFFIVVMFFAVFGIIVFTEIFFIDEKDKAAGVMVRHGAIGFQQKDREYDSDFQADDYISIRVGQVMMDNPDISDILLGRPQTHELAVSNFGHQFVSKFMNEGLLPPYPENLSISNGSWQNVLGTRYKFYVFSAYYDQRRNQRNVRIIAATKTRGPERVWCRFWYKHADNATANISKAVPAKLKVIRENWNLRYSACFVMCPLKANLTIPTAVSVVARLKDPPSNVLSVINNFNVSNNVKLPGAIDKFAVCVKPLHFNYNKELQIMEFIELNRLMGVDHLTFYNHTIGPQVSCVLDDYRRRGIVTLLPWKLQMVSQREIRTEGLFAALNDCLYRSMYHYSHALLIDLDEYIIPNYNETLPQLIDYLNHRLNTRSTGSYSFQNAFFYLQWDDDGRVSDFDDVISSNLITMRKTRRKTKLHPHKQRSKYICRPELVVEAGNHFVWEFIPGHGTLNVPADAAILHHYRICEFGGNDCIKTASVVDQTAYRYLEGLTKAVRRRYEQLKQKCGLSKPKEAPTKMFHKILQMLKTGAQRK
ncbi:beta-1,4-galactosyltransferase galt-1 [Anthonomus grandis grandis]|uniref:beta-1,4-galactosyltransferase galt-1 n=1 Tax=Anthonomus grandis grandis TaxID=2921223 RepID=UPI002165417F|nr:beta-1,4-galactosyltransferase galt-1 [Anthonomus grandis grandis]XP_050311086.1 beta-1,4-galactosyltransferase galt-1 [Anthonomus grandis grandis]XP_050311088.1 beta-1,4-galactosyltransferase galt-1 [Anthonomus grandis grandis]XP_050311089.1 beta-1,4-galactosyltransferase galt-1 [Anthonomus grandis grandis]